MKEYGVRNRPAYRLTDGITFNVVAKAQGTGVGGIGGVKKRLSVARY